MINRKKIISEIFDKYGLKIDEDDSILIFLAVQEEIINQYTDGITASVKKINDSSAEQMKLLLEQLKEQHQQNLEAINEQHTINTNELKDMINKGANNTLDHAGQEIRDSNKEFLKIIEDMLKEPFDKSVQNNTLIYVLAIVAGGSALFSLLVLIFSIL